MSARSIGWSVLLIPAIVAPALGQDYADPAAGERLATANCAQCHGGVDAPGGAPAFVAIAATQSTTEESLLAFLETPHASMPDLILSEKDRHDLVEYILSLRP
jgi:mono/diheme cytochrome c family protein